MPISSFQHLSLPNTYLTPAVLSRISEENVFKKKHYPRFSYFLPCIFHLPTCADAAVSELLVVASAESGFPSAKQGTEGFFLLPEKVSLLPSVTATITAAASISPNPAEMETVPAGGGRALSLRRAVLEDSDNHARRRESSLLAGSQDPSCCGLQFISSISLFFHTQ